MDDKTAHNPDATPRSRRSRWRRFSLRTFLIGITILCVVLGSVTSTASRQRHARQELRDLGVSVMYEHEWQHYRNPQSWTSRLLEPLTAYVDPDLVLPVTVVRTRHLEERSLRAGATYTSADVIDPISKLPSLVLLNLTHSDVTNQDFARLAHLRKLEDLNLHMTKMHEGPIPGLAQLRLKTLLLNRTRIDDESIAELQAMYTLEHLDLTRTKVTDAGLKHLESLPNLRKLVLRRSLVTRGGYEAFQQAHPSIQVSWEPLK